MKGLATLIKLHKRTLDDLRRKMASLENQKSQLQLLSKTLHKELLDEMDSAGKQADMAQFFGGFAERIKKRQQGIADEIASLDKQMAELSIKISAEFAELKKFEIALANAKKRIADEAKRQETILLDEVAAQQHRRKKEETT